MLSRTSLLNRLKILRRSGKKIVFTNGCFDILHLGHISLVEKARRLGDVLVVGINSDNSVRRLKDKSRPLVGQKDRARVLSSLRSVDFVSIFNEETPARLIAAIQPDVLVKGADWKTGQIVGAKDAGRVVRVPLVPGRSTTALIRKMSRCARNSVE